MKTAIRNIIVTMRRVAALCAIFMLASGCLGVTNESETDPDNGNGGGNPSVTAPEPRALSAYGNCDELLNELKAQAISQMESALDSYYECYDYGYEDDGDMTTEAPTSSGASDSSTGSSGAEESAISFTDTNVQEKGVDEADTVKSDGEFLFVANGGGIDVFRVWPLSEFGKIATYDFESAAGLYLANDELIVLKSASAYESDWYGSSYGNGSTVEVTALDVSDPESPVTLWEKTVGGSLVSSRLTGGALHVVVSATLSYDIDYPAWDYENYETACGGEEQAEEARAILDLEIAQSKAALRTEIEAAQLQDWLPDNDVELDASCGNIFADGDEATNLVGLASIGIDGESEQISYVKGRAMEVYASTGSIYFSANRESAGWWWVAESDGDEPEDAVDIHRFEIGGNGALHAYAGSGAVAGHVLDQFSMSEYEGTLRVATTVGHVAREGTADVYSNVFILDAASPTLDTLGSVTGIAPTEQIYAARFVGTKGYVVTFEKVDPLFVIDLADPMNPTIEGELTIPGYSTYLHPLDDGTLIGLGKDAEDAGTFSWYQGLKLGVYDVEDASLPAVVEEIIIGSRGSDSPALYDHHAFNFDTETGILALPLTLYEGGTGGSDSGTYEYAGVHFYALTAAGGIETLAEVPIAEDSSSYAYSSDVPQRTLMVGETEGRGAYVIGSEKVTLIDMGGYEIADSAELSGSYYAY